MLIIETAPDSVVPQELGKPLLWTIRNPDYILTPGAFASMSFLYSAGGDASGISFELGGVAFETSGATVEGYTESTYYPAPAVQDAAENFANMIRSNFRFVDWSVSLDYTSSAPAIVINIVKGERGREPDEDWVNDVSGITGIGDSNFIQGTDEARANARLWYQFWRANTPISEKKTADFDQTGRVRIDGQNVASQVLGITAPYLLWVQPAFDALASRNIYLRFGVYELDNCEQVFEQVYETPEITIVNAIFQHNWLSQFRPYTAQVTQPVNWMTDRAMDRVVCRRSFEWVAIFIMKYSTEFSGSWRVKYVYYNSSGVEIGSATRSFKGEGVYHVPTGPQNPCHASGVIPLSSYYTVQVEVRNEAMEWVPYSVEQTIRMDNCNCHVAEIYYLEDRGSWQTLGFERLAQRRLEVTTVDFERPLATNYNGGPLNVIQLFQVGGRYSEADISEAVFTLTSEKITEHNRQGLEEFLRSKEHYILTSSDLLNAATRRVLIDRGSKVLFQRGSVSRLTVDFRFNVPQRVRP